MFLAESKHCMIMTWKFVLQNYVIYMVSSESNLMSLRIQFYGYKILEFR